MTDKTIAIDGQSFVICECIICGSRFVVAQTVIEVQRKEGGFHHCPAGHRQGWSKDGSENEKLRRERDLLQQQIARKDDEIRETNERLGKERRKAARLAKRAEAGLCSCCNRHFENLKRHMKSKHSNVVKLPSSAA